GEAMFFVGNGRHQFASGVMKEVRRGIVRLGSALQVGIGIGPRAAGLGLGTMAIVTLQCDLTLGASYVGAPVLMMAEGDRTGSRRSRAQRGKIGMVTVESTDVSHESSASLGGVEISMALHALRVTHVVQLNKPLVFHMARRA